MKSPVANPPLTPEQRDHGKEVVDEEATDLILLNLVG